MLTPDARREMSRSLWSMTPELSPVRPSASRRSVSDTRARYTREGDHVAVVNECLTADGRHSRAQDIAKAVEDNGSARLRLGFFRTFYGDYWVLALDPGYRWALVGEPRRGYAWILARSPHPDAATRTALPAGAAELGFDRAAFASTPHTQP